MMTMGHGMSVLLVTSAVGYWTLTSAGKEKGRVKLLGQYLGLLIIVLSLASGACKMYCAMRACQASHGGYFGGKGCPWSKKMSGMTCPREQAPAEEYPEPEPAPVQK